MTLSQDMISDIYESLDDAYTQVKFFQDQVIITDDAKSSWDNAIKRLDSELMGEIAVVNDAMDVVKDLYAGTSAGVNSCRSDLFWMATAYNDTEDEYTLTCTKLNENGYTDIVRSTSGNLCGIGSTYFLYLDPADAGIKTAPINRVAALEQGRSVDDVLFGFSPRNYYGLKYYSEQYALDIGDTFVTSFIGTVNIGSNLLTVMTPVAETGQDSGSPVLEVGQLVTCEKEGVIVATTKIVGISIGTADLSQIPTSHITETSSIVNILTLSPPVGLGVSVFDSVSFRVLDNPDTGAVGQISEVTSNGNVYLPNAIGGDGFYAIPSTTDGAGEGATFVIYTDSSGGIAPTGLSTITGGVGIDVIGNAGLGYAVGDTITIGGTSLTLANGDPGTAADNLTFTVTANREGRIKYALNVSSNMDTWLDPFIPQTVGIIDDSTVGIGIKVELDSSGDPRSPQGWDPNLNGYETPENPNLPHNSSTNPLVLVSPPTVGADKSYWKVGFQKAPKGASSRAYEGETSTAVDASSLSSELTVIPDCSASVNTSISDAIAIVNTSETSFYSKDGLHKQMIDATNALRGERNDLCLRIWGQRQSIGQLNQRINRLENLRGYILREAIEERLE